MHRAASALRGHLPLAPDDPLVGVGPGDDRLRFDRFVLSPSQRLLTRDGVPVAIGGRSFDLLLALVEKAGRVVPKRDLLQRVWPDVVVEDAALRFHMTRLRGLLGDGREGVRLITTQVGVGYAFVGAVRSAETEPTLAPRPSGGSPEAALPARLDRMIGRDQDLDALVRRAAASRLLTIVGPAGVGKTSLAVELAHHLAADLAHGAVFVDLAAIDAADRLAWAIAQALNLKADPEDPTAAVLGHLRGRRLLLVLDNCEHLVQAAADLVERIAAAAPEVQIVATSRQALRARNEHVHRLSPHALPVDVAAEDDEALRACSAVELFLHHARTAGGAVGEEVETVRTIARMCRRLDGVALAIELAAVRAATHGIEATSWMLGDGLSLSWPGRRTASPRQRTLKATLDWSYALLSDTERRVFERLSGLAGPFSLETALATVVDDALDVAAAAAALDELADKSLILPRDGVYHWFEATRIHARERLDARLGEEIRFIPRTVPARRYPRTKMLRSHCEPALAACPQSSLSSSASGL